VRLFIAINLPDPARQALYDAALPLRRAAPSVRWVTPDTLHITLKFLGEVRDRELEPVVGALRAAAASIPVFPLELRGVGAFPNLRRPRVYWVGATGGRTLSGLQSNLETQLESLGYAREARPFHPHVTLGRAGNQPARDDFVRAERAAAEVEYEASVAVQSVELMQSRLAPGGARYEIVERVPLSDRS
jgi:2'-5' RNA ligase